MFPHIGGTDNTKKKSSSATSNQSPDNNAFGATSNQGSVNNFPNTIFPESNSMGQWDPLNMNAQGDSFLRWLQGSDKEDSKSNGFKKYDGPELSKSEYSEIINKEAKANGVDPNIIYLIGLHESGFKPNATSKANCKGIMQLCDATAKDMGVKNSYDPKENIMGGTKYFADLLRQFNGNTSLALAAYNAGPGAVRKYNGIPPYPETQNYVKAIMADYRKLPNA